MLEERVPPSEIVPREEAVARLTLRYFTSHGPATVRDFAWWSGLRMADIRQGLDSVREHLVGEVIGDETYWFVDGGQGKKKLPRTVRLLPAYDEFMVSYKDRTASLAPDFTKATITGNGIFKPIIVLDGNVVGIWKRSSVRENVRIEPFFFNPSTVLKKGELAAAANEFGQFVGMDVDLL